jgi:hypothetical protein
MSSWLRLLVQKPIRCSISYAPGLSKRISLRDTRSQKGPQVIEKRPETCRSEGALKFLVFLMFLMFRLRNVGTRTGPGARVRKTIVPVKRVRPRGREVLYIRSDSAPERVRNLGWRIAGNHVAADDVASHVPTPAKIDPVDVPANLIILNQIVLAYTQESQTEIVAIGGRGGRLGGSRTVAIESVQPNPVVAAARHSSSAARCSV